MGNGDFVRRGRKSQKCIMRLFWRTANLLGDAPVKKIMLSLYLSYAPGPILSKLGQNFDWLIHAYIFVLHRQLKLCVILRFFFTFVFLNCRHRIKYICYQGFFFRSRLVCLFCVCLKKAFEIYQWPLFWELIQQSVSVADLTYWPSGTA